MKISEVIDTLQALKEEHGDIEVMSYTDMECTGYYSEVVDGNVVYSKEDNSVIFL